MKDEIHQKNAESINGKNHRKTTTLSMKCIFQLNICKSISYFDKFLGLEVL